MYTINLIKYLTFKNIFLTLFILWILSGFYKVSPSEQGIVLRFGKFIKKTQPGLHYHIPYPVEYVQTVNVTQERSINIGFRSVDRGVEDRDVLEEKLMLTGDENIVSIGFSVLYNIKDSTHFLFKNRYPESILKRASESAMKEVIAKRTIWSIFEERSEIEVETKQIIERSLNKYETGININRVQIEKVDLPDEAIDAYNNILKAKKDIEIKIKNAYAYKTSIISSTRNKLLDIDSEIEIIISQFAKNPINCGGKE